MPVRILFVGHDSRDPFIILGKSYLSRSARILSPKVEEVKESKRKPKSNLSAVESEEAQLLLEKSKGCYRIALDENGKQLSSLQFAKKLEQNLSRGKEVAFLIGGATGLSPALLKECDETWSLSALTFPHRIAFLLLSEQIYRAGEILRGGPYHKV